MKIKKITPFLSALLIGLLVLPLGFAFGLDSPPTDTWTSWDDIEDFVDFVMQAVYTLFLIVVVICLVLAAFNFITAGGDENKIAKAKEWVKYALIGVVIALLAGGVVALLTNLLGAPTS
jgi:fumarate reductase subunit D